MPLLFKHHFLQRWYKTIVNHRRQRKGPRMETRPGTSLPVLALALSGFFLTPPPASAGTVFWVSPSGQDGDGRGSEGTPLKTMADAVSRAVSGDTVRLTPGEFRETVQCVAKSGITLRGCGSRAWADQACAMTRSPTRRTPFRSSLHATTPLLIFLVDLIIFSHIDQYYREDDSCCPSACTKPKPISPP